MLKNYLKVALRTIARYKGYSFINVAGLMVGMAVCMLIMLWVQNELSYDRFYENASNIYRITRESSHVTPPAMAAALEQQIPEITKAAKYRGLGPRMINNGTQSFTGSKLHLVDPKFFDIFDFPFIKGDPSTVLSDPHGIVITEEVAVRCFGDEDPIGKSLRLDNTFDMHVTGVIGRLPGPTVLQFDLLAHTNLLVEMWNEDLEEWRYSSYRTFVLVDSRANPTEVASKITTIYNERVADNPRQCGLQPLTDIHLYQVSGESGAAVYVYIFTAIALAVLAIAGINFINLTTSRGVKRAREVGIRKVVGANRSSLIRQFLGEAVLLSMAAFFGAIRLCELLSPAFSQLAGQQLAIDYVGDTRFVLAASGVALLVGLLAGLFPAIIMSSYQPIVALRKSKTTGGGTRSPLRRALVLIQFALSIILIVGTVTIYNQLDYMKNAELGYDKEHIICLETTGDHIMSIAPAFRELLSHAHIEAADICGTLPGRRESSSTRLTWEGQEPGQQLSMEIIYASYGFLETFGVEMAHGRYYSQEFPSDLQDGFVVNEEAVNAMGFTNETAIGKKFSLYDKSGYIIGVVNDFHSQSLHHEIDPLILHLNVYPNDNLVFRLSPTDVAGTLAYMESVWEKHAPDYPFEYWFFDETLDALYKAEQRMGTISGYLAGLGIFISCLGLLGLAAFMAEQRTKEMGVRKVLGASMTGIVRLLSKEFIVLVVIANVIAFPIAYYVMNRWLEGFVYHTTMNWETFVLVGFGAAVLALATVGYQAIKVARTNPVKTLRYE